jgi:hypothetical protein
MINGVDPTGPDSAELDGDDDDNSDDDDAYDVDDDTMLRFADRGSRFTWLAIRWI